MSRLVDPMATGDRAALRAAGVPTARDAERRAEAIGRYEGQTARDDIPVGATLAVGDSLATTVAATTSTTTYEENVTYALVLPEGGWEVWIDALAAVRHNTAGGTVDARLLFDGAEVDFKGTSILTAQDYISVPLTATIAETGGGEYPVTIEYRCGSAGTAAARTGKIAVYARRLV